MAVTITLSNTTTAHCEPRRFTCFMHVARKGINRKRKRTIRQNKRKETGKKVRTERRNID